MKFACFIFPLALVLTLASCKPLTPEVTSKDCTVAAVPSGFTRIYIGAPAHGGQQSGTSAKDPLDGTTADKFDSILRTIAQGELPTWGSQKNIAAENLVVCVASGTFQTNGAYTGVIGGQRQGNHPGFTVEKNWKIHGSGTGHTILRLASYIPDQFIDRDGSAFSGGRNIVITTHSVESSGVEVSDLTIDANHDQLTAPGGPPLNLAAIVLRSDQGNHWIHNVNVVGASGDAGFRNVLYEGFAVQIWGNSTTLDPRQSTGNLIENVTITKPGRPMTGSSPPGGAMDGIVINTGTGEVRNNVVEGYLIAYGGWAMDGVWFHDNVARNTYYGFNADALTNNGVILESNQIIHPIRYGIIIGGGGLGHTFSNWNVMRNTVTVNASGTIAVGIRGQVQGSNFAENTLQSDSSTATNLGAILSYSSAAGLVNFNNVFQDNHIDKAMRVDFSGDPNFNTNCRFQNRDLQGLARQDFPDNSSSKCR